MSLAFCLRSSSTNLSWQYSPLLVFSSLFLFVFLLDIVPLEKQSFSLSLSQVHLAWVQIETADLGPLDCALGEGP